MIRYKIYEFYPGFGNDDKLTLLALPDESLRGLFDDIEKAVEAIEKYGGKQEYAIITVFKKKSKE